MKTTVLYAFFALIATGVNLGIQALVFSFLNHHLVLLAALSAGTLAGLVTKYLLDKRWIFHFRAPSRREDLSRFLLYSLMGVFTTGIFWGTEITFFFLFDFRGAHYAGGALGLSVGYTAKFLLDRRYVFQVQETTGKAQGVEPNPGYLRIW